MAEDKKWYVVRVISGQEKKIREHIILEINRAKWDKVVLNILVPTEKVYTIKAGKSATFTVSKTIDSTKMFAGTYAFSLSLLPSDSTGKKLPFTNIATTNSVTVVGENASVTKAKVTNQDGSLVLRYDNSQKESSLVATTLT